MLVCANKRVRNRSQIPLRAAIRCARGFALLHFAAVCCEISAPQNFDSVATQPSLRMTLGVTVRRMTHGVTVRRMTYGVTVRRMTYGVTVRRMTYGGCDILIFS